MARAVGVSSIPKADGLRWVIFGVHARLYLTRWIFVCPVVSLRLVAAHHTVTRQVVTSRCVPIRRFLMGLEAVLDRQQRDEAPAGDTSVFPFTADVRDAVAGAEPRREIRSSAQRGY